ncbi:MAG: cysteine-rich KTR domain-containing protein [Sphaerochaetaceae bacterium]|nr:cysteine-rich KTR domain-containing protein [Sphaerochaetaceae bacterium]
MCPFCGGKTRTQYNADTVLKAFPLYCPKCRSECEIEFEKGRITRINKVPDAKTQCKAK